MKAQHSILRGVLAAGSLCLIAGLALAAGKGHVVSQLSVFKITGSTGHEAAQAADSLKPGEVLEYRLRYTNDGDANVGNVQATLPIPAGLEYQPEGTTLNALMASTDGRNYGVIPLQKSEKDATGQAKTVAVPFSEYRYLRWNVGNLAAGASASVAARVHLPQDTAKASSEAKAR